MYLPRSCGDGSKLVDGWPMRTTGKKVAPLYLPRRCGDSPSLVDTRPVTGPEPRLFRQTLCSDFEFEVADGSEEEDEL